MHKTERKPTYQDADAHALRLGRFSSGGTRAVSLSRNLPAHEHVLVWEAEEAIAHDEEHEDDQPRPLALPRLRRMQHDDAVPKFTWKLEVEQLAAFWGRLHPGRESHSFRRGFLGEGEGRVVVVSGADSHWTILPLVYGTMAAAGS